VAAKVEQQAALSRALDAALERDLQSDAATDKDKVRADFKK